MASHKNKKYPTTAEKKKTPNKVFQLVSKGSVIVVGFLVIWGLFYFIDVWKNKTVYKPEFRLDSASVCPINTSKSNKAVIFYLKLDIKNTNNSTRFCIDPFDVSVFAYTNRQQLLLAKATFTHLTCVEPRHHTTVTTWVEAEAEPEVEAALDDRNGVFRFDLRFHSRIYFDYNHDLSGYRGDVVCRDVKIVSWATPQSKLSCRSLVGDCFFDSYDCFWCRWPDG